MFQQKLQNPEESSYNKENTQKICEDSHLEVQHTLQKAIEQIALFTDVQDVEVGRDGTLVVSRESMLEQVIKLASQTLNPFLFGQKGSPQKTKVLELKKAILNAREVIQNNIPVIERLTRGDEKDKKFANNAISIIAKYNHIVTSADECSKEKNNCSKDFLLQDKEIKGIRIKTQPNEKIDLSSNKRLMQFMVDTCRMKAIRLLKNHLDKTSAEVLPLVKQEEPEIAQEENGRIIVKQFIRVNSKKILTLRGVFYKISSSHLPLIEGFELFSDIAEEP